MSVISGRKTNVAQIRWVFISFSCKSLGRKPRVSLKLDHIRDQISYILWLYSVGLNLKIQDGNTGSRMEEGR